MLFHNHLVNITQILEEETAMVLIFLKAGQSPCAGTARIC